MHEKQTATPRPSRFEAVQLHQWPIAARLPFPPGGQGGPAEIYYRRFPPYTQLLVLPVKLERM
jgi:hypothetical protein